MLQQVGPRRSFEVWQKLDCQQSPLSRALLARVTSGSNKRSQTDRSTNNDCGEKVSNRETRGFLQVVVRLLWREIHAVLEISSSVFVPLEDVDLYSRSK